MGSFCREFQLNGSFDPNIDVILLVVIHNEHLFLVLALRFPIHPHHSIFALNYKNVLVI